MSCTTINLTTIPPDYSEPLLNLEFIYAEDRRELISLHKKYKSQRKLAAKHLNQWFRLSNENLIKQVHEFIRNSLDLNNESLFPTSNSKLISGASLVLGMHCSDHKATFDLIEEHVHDIYTNVTLYRIDSEFTKRAQFMDLVYEIREQTNVLIIIEQLETIDRFLLKIFITILHDLLTETSLENVMCIFGMSTNWENLGSVLPNGALNRIRIRATITQDINNDVSQIIEEKLLSVDEYDLKIGPSVLNFIYYTVLERDTSIANLSYLFQYCILEHNLSSRACLNLPKRQLVEMFRSKPELISQLLQLESLSNSSIITKKPSPEEVAEFCFKSITDSKTYFKFAWSQIRCYYLLLRDETGESFPGHTFEIYEEMIVNGNLGNSQKFIDSILGFSKLPSVKLLKRLELCCSEVEKLNGNLNEKDIRSKLVRIRDKIINNENHKDVRDELSKLLMNHAGLLKGPKELPCYEAIYFNAEKTLIKRTIPTTRLDASKTFIDSNSCFGLLYGLIHNGSEVIGLIDLYEDFVSAVDENQILTKNPIRKSTGVKLKTTAKRSTRSSLLTKPQNDTHLSPLPSSTDSSLTKTIFMDLLECFLIHGLIVKDTRQSQSGIVRRCVWL